jgi:hypothetical protein
MNSVASAGRTRFILALASAVVITGKLKAQSAQAISLQVSGLYNGLYGDVFGAFKNGIGGEAQIRYTPGALSVGAGFQYTAHGRKPSPIDPEPVDASLYGGFIEPRYRIHTGSNVIAPYVSARFSVLKPGFDGGSLSSSSTFIQLNAGGGLLYRLGSRFNLDAGATFGYNHQGGGTLTGVTSNGRPVNQRVESASGTNIVVRVGLAVGLGG